MSSESDDMNTQKTVCMHMMIERVATDPEVVDLNGHGTLRAEFKCGNCGTLFYEIVPSKGPKKTKVI